MSPFYKLLFNEETQKEERVLMTEDEWNWMKKWAKEEDPMGRLKPGRLKRSGDKPRGR